MSHEFESASGAAAQESETPIEKRFQRVYEHTSETPIDDLILFSKEKLDEADVTSVLKTRYEDTQDPKIYTYIGNVILSINPYRQIKGLYNNRVKDFYHTHYPFELAPHLYSIAEDAYRTMLESGKPQSVVISGESGAGKTEASKIIMEYIAAVSVSGKQTDVVKKNILETIPILEAFGNAATNKNFNSSRFGRYTDLYFQFEGKLEGAHISSLLLEKQRVVQQKKGERNFHIFYQICSDDQTRRDFGLQTAEHYNYLNSNPTVLDDLDDKYEFQRLTNSLRLAGISITEQVELFRLCAAILKLGNITFKPIHTNNQDSCEVENMDLFSNVANLLQVDTEKLKNSLLYRTITIGGKGTESITQNAEKAAQNRDALAKHIYERLFQWLITRVNSLLKKPSDQNSTIQYHSIGILDIYGFEIFEDDSAIRNTFDQLLINHVNEKIQQRIQQALLEEQKIYASEGVSINNSMKHYACDKVVELIEKRMGIYSILDEESMIPKGNDSNYLQKLVKSIQEPEYFEIPRLSSLTFALRHYAAQVKYSVESWVERNRDTVSVDLIQTMQTSKLDLMIELYPKSEKLVEQKRLQNTVVGHFKKEVNSLVAKLSQKKLHFIRCILPNRDKRPNHFDAATVLDQVKYLGLIETVLVRKAGFNVKLPFSLFIQRYKLTCKDTWPNYQGTEAKDGCELVLKANNIDSDKYVLGKTQVFLESPSILFELDARVELRKAEMAIIIQKAYRKYKLSKAAKEFAAIVSAIPTKQVNDIKLRADAYRLTSSAKQHKVLLVLGDSSLVLLDSETKTPVSTIAYSDLKKVMASGKQDSLIVLVTSGEVDECLELEEDKHSVIELLQQIYKEQTNQSLESEFIDELQWRSEPGVTKRIVFRANKFFKTTTIMLESDDTIVVNTKDSVNALAGKKLRKKTSLNRKFYGDYLRLKNGPLMKQLHEDFGDSSVDFSAVVTKYNKSYKKQDRVLLITDNSIYNCEPNGYMVNRKMPIEKVKSVLVSPFCDDFLVLSIEGEYDYLLETSKKSEIIQVLCNNFRSKTRRNLKVLVKDSTSVVLSKKSKVDQEETKQVLTWKEEEQIKKTKLKPCKGGAEILVKKEGYTDNETQNLEMIKDIYNGLKLRRRDSLLAFYLGDYLHLESNAKIKPVLEKYHSSKIIFSARVNKLNKRYKVQSRRLIIADTTVLALDEDSLKVNRAIPIEKIASISVSPLLDGFFFINVSNEYSYIFESNKKTEIIKTISDLYKQLTNGKQLPITVEDKITYQIGDTNDGVRVAEFKHDSKVVAPMILPHANGFTVKINNEDASAADQYESLMESGNNRNSVNAAGNRQSKAFTQALGVHKENFAGILDTDAQSSIYGGRKGRLRQTMMREFLGDYCNLTENTRIKQIMDRFGDSKIVFSAVVDKFNKSNKKQNRIVMITDKALYNIDEEGYRVQRRIALNDIQGASVSTFADNILVLHVPSEYDLVIASDKKTEMIHAINSQKIEQGKKPIKVNVAEKFDYCPQQNQYAELLFVLDDNASETWLEQTSKGLVVHVNNKQQAVVLEAAYVIIKDHEKPIEVKSQAIEIKLNKKWTYKLEVRFYVNENLAETTFHEKIDTITKRIEYSNQLAPLKAREERYVITLPERNVVYSLLSKTRVKAKLCSATGEVLLAVRFVYDVR